MALFAKRNQNKRCSYSRCSSNKLWPLHGLKSDCNRFREPKATLFRRSRRVICKQLWLIAFGLMLLVLFSLPSLLLSTIIHHKSLPFVSTLRYTKDLKKDGTVQKSGYLDGIGQGVIYKHLLSLASISILKDGSHDDSSNLWDEPNAQEYKWKPCAGNSNHLLQDRPSVKGHDTQNSGYIAVSANGGLNQQRVAVCNAVVVAVLLNASLVLPKFLYSSVWKDISQFGDIYQEEYFVNYLRDDINIVRELPSHLQSLDFEAIGSQITDSDIVKESTPIQFIRTALPLLQKNGVVHFLGFVNRLGFDPLESNLQRLRCKCNFHALKFAPKIQEVGSLLIKRLTNYGSRLTEIQKQLLGNRMPVVPVKAGSSSKSSAKYLALHLRFEIDMVSYSQCYFGGGEKERNELQAYRERHFPRLVEQMRNNSVSPNVLRKLGKCPLTPEEAALVLSAVGFKPETYVYLAGSNIYGGKSRLHSLTTLFPNLVTKEDLLTPSELAPLRNFSSQLAALDFITCAAADVFAMTDSGSQLSSLVSGFRVYHGCGHAPTLRPSKKQLASILSKGRSLEWSDFVERVKNMINEDQRTQERFRGRSIYRQPRSEGCMCRD